MHVIRLGWLVVVGMLLQGCVSESTIVDDKRHTERQTDHKQMARTRLALGLSYLERGDTAQARFNLEKAREMDNSLSEVYNALAYYYQKVGELDQAEQAYHESLRRDSDNPDTYNNFGALLCQRQKFAQAEQLLQTAIKKPGYIRVADSYENLALCARSQLDFDKYQQYLQQALRHNTMKPSLLYANAAWFYAKNELTESSQYLQRLHQLGHVAPAVSFLRYLVADLQHDSAAKLAAEKFLLSVYPASAEASWIISGDFSAAEPEKLRQAYLANVIGSQDTSRNDESKPKIKVVKRKTGLAPESEAYALTGEEPLQPLVVDAPVQVEAPTPVAKTLPTDDLTLASSIDAAIPNPPAVSTESAAQPVEAVSSAPVQQAQPSAQSTPTGIHIVQYGETLYRIASKYRLTVSELQQLNQMKDPSELRAGQKLKVVAPSAANDSYQVLAGDTIFSIAYKLNLSAEQLATVNQLSPDAVLSAGQTLQLPSVKSAQ